MFPAVYGLGEMTDEDNHTDSIGLFDSLPFSGRMRETPLLVRAERDVARRSVGNDQTDRGEQEAVRGDVEANGVSIRSESSV